MNALKMTKELVDYYPCRIHDKGPGAWGVRSHDDFEQYLEGGKAAAYVAANLLNGLPAQADLINFVTDPKEIHDLASITRVEVIDKTGRAYTNMKAENVSLSFQDDNRTLKVFID